LFAVEWRCREEDIDTLRILVATDCHLGYMEKDEIRRFDSFQAFEEICSLAEQKKVGRRRILFLINLFILLSTTHCLRVITGMRLIAGRLCASWW
jgi:hypothetical protein